MPVQLAIDSMHPPHPSLTSWFLLPIVDIKLDLPGGLGKLPEENTTQCYLSGTQCLQSISPILVVFWYQKKFIGTMTYFFSKRQ